MDALASRVEEELKSRLAEVVRESLRRVELQRVEGTYVYARNYDLLKYRVAKAIASSLSVIDCLEGVYYADIASGEYITGQVYFGRDVDVIVLLDEGGCPWAPGLLKRVERVANAVIAEVARREGAGWLADIAETNGVVEIHFDDIYVKMVRDKKSRGSLSDLNVIEVTQR